MRTIGKRFPLGIAVLCKDRRVRHVPHWRKRRRSEDVIRPRRAVRVVSLGRPEREKRERRGHAVGVTRSTTITQGRLDSLGRSAVELLLVRLALAVRQVGSRRRCLVSGNLDRVGRRAERVVVERVRVRISRRRQGESVFFRAVIQA